MIDYTVQLNLQITSSLGKGVTINIAGLHGWIVYVVVGMVLAFVSYRKDMPMTMKSCFYPLIG